MRKIACLGLSGLLLFAACQKKNDSLVPNDLTKQPVSRQKLDATIKETVLHTGRFNWSDATDEMVWSALQHGDDVVSVGFKPADFTSDLSSNIHKIDIKTGAWAEAKEQLLQLILKEESKLNNNLTLTALEAYDEKVLPAIDVHLKSLATIKLLRTLKTVRYIEPMGYEPQGFVENPTTSGIQSGVSGCSEAVGNASLVNGSDFTIIAPNAKQSWNYVFHNIPAAWTKSTGSGIKVMIIDSGISSTQDVFGANFNNGSSAGRTIEKAVTLRKPAFLGLGTGSVENSTADECGHGTLMSGICAAPRSTLGASTGVAYNCDLVVVRASTDVLINESRETKGVADAFTLAGSRADIKIVSMSMGRITSNSQIGDAIDYAYNNGKLIFCAGGTSFGWSAGWFGVIFPATKSNVSAVTGVKDNLTRCNNCHDGSEIDFTVVMQKASNDRVVTTTALTGATPATVGGSSAATATTAGIAALVWSRNTTLTRDQVLTKLIQNSSNYPNKSNSKGWGLINADLASN